MAIDTLGWFSARIVLERTVEEASGIPLLFEERILLVRATTEGEAAQRAEHFVKGRREAHSNQFGNTVVWEFKEVLDVKRLINDTVVDGSEVYSMASWQQKSRIRSGEWLRRRWMREHPQSFEILGP